MKVKTIRLTDDIRKRYRRVFMGMAPIKEAVVKSKTGQVVAVKFRKTRDHDVHTIRGSVLNACRRMKTSVATRIHKNTLYVWKAD